MKYFQYIQWELRLERCARLVHYSIEFESKEYRTKIQ